MREKSPRLRTWLSGWMACLRKRQGFVTGILNGVDYEEWNTTNNPHLKHPYAVTDLEGKLRANSISRRNSACP